MKKEDFVKLCRKISKDFQKINIKWGGKKAIEDMKKNNSKNWRQMEWIGFYFEFLCQKILKNFEFNKIKYKNVSFDGFNEIPWDFKSHATNTSSHKIIINDKEAILKGIKDFGVVGLILAIGDVKYNDENRTFQKWHEKLKGGKSKYEIDRIQRGAWSRFRKVNFKLKQICFVGLNKKLLEKTGSFQKDFRNSNGEKRKEKILLDLEKLDKKKDFIYFINY